MGSVRWTIVPKDNPKAGRIFVGAAWLGLRSAVAVHGSVFTALQLDVKVSLNHRLWVG